MRRTRRRLVVMKIVLIIKAHFLLTLWQVKAQMLERETKECRVRTEEWYVLFLHVQTVGGRRGGVVFFYFLLFNGPVVPFFCFF